MAQDVELIQLEVNDDVTSISDRLTFLRGRSVLLIWPEKGTALTRKLDLVLIQRQAKRLAIKLALVTHDPDVTRHAAELGISTFETIGGSARGKWQRGRARVFTNRDHKPESEPEPEDLMPVASRVRIEAVDTPSRRVFRLISRAVVLLLLVGLVAALGYLLIPGATVTISPAREIVQIDAAITANPNLETPLVDAATGVIPALRLRVEIEERGTIPTTGRQTLSDTLARGTVVFINKTNEAVEIPADLVVGTSAGDPIYFRTLQSATLAAGQGLQAEVPVEALPDFPGEVGNVDANLINAIIDTLADRLEVRNVSPTSGGSSSGVSAVRQEDRDLLINTLRQQLQSRAYSEMLTRLQASQFIIPETIRIAEEREDWMQFDFQVGEVADTLTLTMRAVVEATAIDEQLAQQVAFTRLAAQVPRGREIRAVDYQRGGGVTLNADGSISFPLTAQAEIVAQVNVAQIRERLAGRTLDDARRYLDTDVDLDDTSPPQITVSPDGFPQMPLLALRINVEVVER
jgi:hypothetical protein